LAAGPNLGGIAGEHLDAEGDQVLDPLTLGVCGRPQLEVLDPVVPSVSVAVTDHLVGSQCSPELLSHHPSVHPDALGTTYQPPKSSRNRDYPVAVVFIACSGDLPNRPVSLGVTGCEVPLVVGSAEPERAL
jgi:hypothetical protein